MGISRDFLAQRLWLGIACLCLPAWVEGAELALPSLTWEVSAIHQRCSGPAVVHVRLQPRPGGLARGHLSGQVSDSFETLVEFTSDEVLLASGTQRIRLVIPPIPLGHESLFLRDQSPLTLQINFECDGRRYPLGDRPLFLGGESGTLAILADATEGQVGALPAGQEFLERLAPERWQLPRAPGSPQVTARIPAWQTRLVDWSVADLPTDPLLYTGFDAVLLSGSGVATLRPDQREGLGHWVAAGGSLGVVLQPTMLRTDSLAWLNRLLADGSNGLLQPTPPDNRVGLPEGETVRLAHFGLGSVVIFAVTDSGTLPDSTALARTLPHLWKWSAPQRDAFLSSGEYKPGQADASRAMPSELSRGATHPGLTLRQQLLPADLKPLGINVMLVLLIAYWLWIGPLDYLVLGRFKARRWTWVTFPLISLLITGALVLLSNWKLAGHESGIPIHLVDVGPGNRPVRVTRLQGVVSPRERRITHSVPRGWISDQSFAERAQSRPRYQGSPSRDLIVDLMVSQWSPRLFRTTWLPAVGVAGTPPELDLPACPIDFEQLLPALMSADTVADKQLAVTNWLKEIASEPWEAHVIHAENDERHGRLPGTERLPILELCQLPQESASIEDGFNPAREPLPVYRRSPSPGGNLRDLCLSDPADPSSWLVLVVTRTPEGEYVVWRKLVMGG